MADKHITPDDVARRLEELQQPVAPKKKPEADNPDDPIGGTGVPAPVKPVTPTLSGKSANPLPHPSEAGEQES